jgi:hypothetical protein
LADNKDNPTPGQGMLDVCKTISAPAEHSVGAVFVYLAFSLSQYKTFIWIGVVAALSGTVAAFSSDTLLNSIDSRKGGDVTRVDVHLSFEDDTKVKEVIDLKNKMQDEFVSEFGNSVFNIVMQEE